MKTETICFVFTLTIGSNLYGQGIPYGQEFQVNTYSDGYQFCPSVAALKYNGFVVTWQSIGQDGSEGGIYAQIFDNFGMKKGDEFLVNTITDHSQEKPAVTGLQDGGFVICWVNWGWIEDSIYDIFCQIFDASGNKKGGQFRANTYTLNFQNSPVAATLQNGDFVLCWESLYQDGSEYGIYAQIFDASGNKRGSEFQVNTTTNDYQCNPSIASLIDGGFVVCWEDYGNGIVAQKFNASGSKRGNEILVDYSINHEEFVPSVAGLCDGGFVVCWQSYEPNGTWGIYGQLFDSSGVKKGARFHVNTTYYYDQMNSSVAGLQKGGFLVCWQSDFQNEFWFDIIGQLFDASGTKI